jgi:hypothetical protein
MRPPLTRGQRGVSLTEFAIVSPIALLLVLGLIQLGFMFVAKQMVNQAAFVAARHGAVNNASESAMRIAVGKALIPFYQNALDGDDSSRIGKAAAAAVVDLAQPWNLSVERLNPSDAAFSDYGLSDPKTGRTYIPNDNLDYRRYAKGAASSMSLQDANALKLRVVYAYELKVPLMQVVFRSAMCGLGSGVTAFGNDSVFSALASPTDCARFYLRGRVPIVAYATVQMQTPAYK